MKIFWKGLGSVTLLLLLAAGIFSFIFWSRVPDMLSDALSRKANVTVQIDEMTLSWKRIGIEKLAIGNPKGSILSKAFSAESIIVNAPLNHYLKEEIVIEEIHIDGVYLGFEFDTATSAKGNWTKIMSYVEASTQEESAHPRSKNRSVFIKKLVLNNISADVVYRNGNQKVKHLRTIPRLELTNISSQGGFPVSQLMKSVLGQTLKSVFVKENLKNMLDDLIHNPPKSSYDLIDSFRRLFGG